MTILCHPTFHTRCNICMTNSLSKALSCFRWILLRFMSPLSFESIFRLTAFSSSSIFSFPFFFSSKKLPLRLTINLACLQLIFQLGFRTQRKQQAWVTKVERRESIYQAPASLLFFIFFWPFIHPQLLRRHNSS